MNIKELYNFENIFKLHSQKKNIILLICLLSVLFVGLVALSVLFLYSNTWLCVVVCFLILAVGYFVNFVLLFIKVQMLNSYLRLLGDLQSGMRKESTCQIVQIGNKNTSLRQLDMKVIVVLQNGSQRELFVESSIELPFCVGDKCQIQAVGGCLVAVGVYES